MRSPGSALVRTACGLALALLATAGCSKKVTAPNSRPVPEGQQDSSMLMMGWSELGQIAFAISDPGTPENPFDDELYGGAEFFRVGPGNLRTATLDASDASQMEAFRIGSDGNVEDMFDFFLPPTLKFIDRGLDLYEFNDPEPPLPASYVGRGVGERVPTTASPVSNRIRVSGTTDESLDFLPPPKLPPGDSVFKIQYTEDPRAAFYVVVVNDGNALLGTGLTGFGNRILRAIPHPLEFGTVPLSSFIIAVIPPGVGEAGISIPLAGLPWPVAFYVRVTAFDADGQMVNRVNDYLRTEGRDGELSLLFYDPMGGAVEMIDPDPNPISAVPAPVVFTKAQAMAILAGFLGGGATPKVVSLGSDASQLRADSGPNSLERQRALARVASAPMFRPEAVRRAIASVRADLDRRSRGEAPGAARVLTPSARPTR